ncbi:Hypothetical predicted protein [Drosophila guanche]|uniref:MD-2-related lipid-recognition domain-containing protein n=1 Tax=Drosophila guanche TaxID=7266 RepID=A0A3B0J1D7_DROGU|nr:Hypothetical predicted protein [Drosophila guanche]
MSAKVGVSVLLIVVACSTSEVAARIEFTNLVCTSLDKAFSDFEYCYLRSVNRTYKYFSIKSVFYQSPITKVKVNLSLHKRFNGYRPFLYNVTVDACRFLRNPRSNPILNFFYGFITPYIGKVSCPFKNSLSYDKIAAEWINKQVTAVLPFPEGDYMIEVNWMAYDINRAITKFYATLS